MNSYFYNLILDYVPIQVQNAIAEHKQEQQNNNTDSDK